MKSNHSNSFKMISNQFTYQFSNRRRSCECQECGMVNKKMHFVISVLPQFQPYQHFKIKIQEQKEKQKQRKQIKMRTKRHLIQKKTLNEIMNSQEPQPKQRSRKHPKTVLYDANQESTFTPNIQLIDTLQTPIRKQSKQFTLLHRYNSFSPRKLGSDRKAAKISTFSQKLKTFYQPITATLDPFIIIRLELIIDQQAIPIKQQGSKDDFEVQLRCFKFEEDDTNIKDIPKLELPPMLPEEDEEDEESEEEVNVSINKQCKINNSKESYKHILKFNKRSFKNVIDKSLLGQSNTIRSLLTTAEASQKLSISPKLTSHKFYQFSPISSLQLLDEKRKQSSIKLNPLILHPISLQTSPEKNKLKIKEPIQNISKKHLTSPLNLCLTPSLQQISKHQSQKLPNIFNSLTKRHKKFHTLQDISKF